MVLHPGWKLICKLRCLTIHLQCLIWWVVECCITRERDGYLGILLIRKVEISSNMLLGIRISIAQWYWNIEWWFNERFSSSFYKKTASACNGWTKVNWKILRLKIDSRHKEEHPTLQDIDAVDYMSWVGLCILELLLVLGQLKKY